MSGRKRCTQCGTKRLFKSIHLDGICKECRPVIFIPVPGRKCLYCGEPLVRRPAETNQSWNIRKYCCTEHRKIMDKLKHTQGPFRPPRPRIPVSHAPKITSNVDMILRRPLT
jgi:hypothetical protein